MARKRYHAKAAPKPEGSSYAFNLAEIEKRMRLLGLYDSAERTMLARHGVVLHEVFGPYADRTEAQARARGHVFWLFSNRYGWSANKIAKWFGMDYSGIRRAIKIEEDLYGKENRKALRAVN